jgi:hypothetical protein
MQTSYYQQNNSYPSQSPSQQQNYNAQPPQVCCPSFIGPV